MLVWLAIALREDLRPVRHQSSRAGANSPETSRSCPQRSRPIPLDQHWMREQYCALHLVGTRPADDSELNKFRLQPSPMGLAPDDDVIVRVHPEYNLISYPSMKNVR